MSTLFSGRPKRPFWIFVRRHLSVTFSCFLVGVYFVLLDIAHLNSMLMQFFSFLLLTFLTLSFPFMRSVKKFIKITPGYLYSVRSVFLKKRIKKIWIAAFGDILLGLGIVFVVLLLIK